MQKGEAGAKYIKSKKLLVGGETTFANTLLDLSKNC